MKNKILKLIIKLNKYVYVYDKQEDVINLYFEDGETVSCNHEEVCFFVQIVNDLSKRHDSENGYWLLSDVKNCIMQK